VVGRQNADIADTLPVREIAMATTFWLSVGYDFRRMIASDTLFDSRGWVFGDKLSNILKAEIKYLRDVSMKTNFGTTLAANGF